MIVDNNEKRIRKTKIVVTLFNESNIDDVVIRKNTIVICITPYIALAKPAVFVYLFVAPTNVFENIIPPEIEYKQIEIRTISIVLKPI
ncbi:hypothetical protein IB642_00145 [Allofrancisella guangzhouensis]|nr:hypothetical protein [Allofrancisella guangzhouensis]